MSESIVDTLMGLLGKVREKDGSHVARQNLQQTYDYPSLASTLPYRFYDETNDLFINTGTVGFILEAAPLPGANEQVIAALDDMLRKKIPRQVPLTVLLVASKCVGERIDQGVSEDMWSGKMAPYLNKITRAFWERSALKGLANKRDYPLYLRNYRVFIVYGQTPKRMNQQFQDEISQLRSTIKVSLEAARIETKNCTVIDELP